MPRRTWAIVLSVIGATVLARALAFQGLDLYTDEAYYWLWSTRPAAGYFDHPPMVAWLVGLSSPLAPGSELAVRAPFLLLGGLSVVFAALAADRLEPGGRAPVYAALLAAGAPMLHLAGAMALPDGPAVAGYAASTWLLARARRTGWLPAGIAVGFALLSKYTAALLAPALVLLVLWDRDLRAELRTPWPWLGGALAVAMFLPNLLWNAGHDWLAIGFQLRHGFRTGATLRTFAEYVGAQLGAAGLVGLPLGVAAGLRARSSAARRVAMASLLPFAVVLWSATRGKMEANWTAHAIPGVAALAGAWLARRGPRLGASLSAAQAALAAAALAFFAAEMRSPWLLRGSVALTRFRSGRGLGAQARAAAREACREVGAPEACGSPPFVYAASFQYAGHLAFYAGWTRQGPAEERPSQLDLWDDRPAPGEPLLYAGQLEGPGDNFRASIRARGESAVRRFEVVFAGAPVRPGTITAFARYEGGQMTR